MLKIETKDSFPGFGDNEKSGEYYFSQGMKRSLNGIKPYWAMSAGTVGVDSGTLTTLAGVITFFVQRLVTTTTTIWGVDATGAVFSVTQGAATWALKAGITTTGYGNGMGVDTENNVIIAGKQKLIKIAPDGTVTNDWQDLGADEGTMWRPIERYEDTTLIGNKNKIATYTGTAVDWNAATITFPAGFVIRCIKSGKNGILIGANFQNRGVLMLWDNFSDRAITPWIWLDEPLYSIAKYGDNWIVAVGEEFIITNGYTYSHLCSPPDNKLGGSLFIKTDSPDCMIVKNNKLFVAGGQGEYNRRQQGIWIYDLRTGYWEFCYLQNFCTIGANIGGLFFDNAYTLYTSFSTSSPAKRYISTITNGGPSKSRLILGPFGRGGNKKTTEGLLIDLGFDMENYSAAADAQLGIYAKVYDFKRSLWGYGLTRAVSTDKSILKVDGSATTYNVAEVGDEVIIIDGLNAGESRHIASIGTPGASETWTMDSAFSELTENGAKFIICPFISIGSYAISSDRLIDNHFYFPIKKTRVGRKFLVEIYLTKGTYIVPEIRSVSLIYNDLGF